MNLSQALKQKNRLAGELVRQQEILRRENARRNDYISTIDREQVWAKIVQISDELGVIKGQITTANIGIYPSIERMAELKSRIAYLESLPKREGPDVSFVGRDQEKLVYTWDSTINQSRCDTVIADLQKQINVLQDNIDEYNAITKIL